MLLQKVTNILDRILIKIQYHLSYIPDLVLCNFFIFMNIKHLFNFYSTTTVMRQLITVKWIFPGWRNAFSNKCLLKCVKIRHHIFIKIKPFCFMLSVTNKSLKKYLIDNLSFRENWIVNRTKSWLYMINDKIKWNEKLCSI